MGGEFWSLGQLHPVWPPALVESSLSGQKCRGEEGEGVAKDKEGEVKKKKTFSHTFSGLLVQWDII